MDVILLEDIKNVGKKDQIIKANDGYARNYLFPKKLAVEANKENLAKLQGRQDSKQFKKDTAKAEAEDIKKKVESIKLEIKVKAGDNGKIFGGVTSKDISENIESQYKISIDKKKIVTDTIKTLGSYNIDIRLYEGVIAKLSLHIVGE